MFVFLENKIKTIIHNSHHNVLYSLKSNCKIVMEFNVN
jgi:hypothetical protein